MKQSQREGFRAFPFSLFLGGRFGVKSANWKKLTNVHLPL